MKKILFPLLGLVFVLFSCKSEKASIEEFNNVMTNAIQVLYDNGLVFGQNVQKAITSKNFSPLADEYNSLKKLIDEQYTKVENTKNVGGSENFKAAILDFLNYEKTLVEKAFHPFTKLTESSTEEEINTAVNNLLTAAEDEKTYLNKARVEQQAYAEKNKFIIQAN